MWRVNYRSLIIYQQMQPQVMETDRLQKWASAGTGRQASLTLYHVGYRVPRIQCGSGQKLDMYYVYVLKSLDNDKLYTGRTSDLKSRIKQHLNKKVRTTKSYGKIKLIFYEAFLSKKDSIRREKYLKTSKGKSSLKQIIRESLRYQ